MAAALQAVLNEHEPDSRGRCRKCRSRTLRRRPAPCRAYLTAHLCLLVSEDDQAADGVPGVQAHNPLGAPG